MKIIDGKIISTKIIDKIQKEVSIIFESKGKRPSLAIIFVGNDPASETYVSAKIKTCDRVGILSEIYRFPNSVLEGDITGKIEELNNDSTYDGILVQLPLPSHIEQRKVLDSINPDKDVDGLSSWNIGLLVSGRPKFVPATPLGVQKLLIESDIKIEGADIVICGRSDIVGKPLSNLLSNKNNYANATVTLCHSKTVNLIDHTKRADILIVAMGIPKFVKEEMVKEGSVIIDVGVNRIADDSRKKGYSIVGDVDFNSVINKVSKITPVPGGVGPMTIAMLLENVLKSSN